MRAYGQEHTGAIEMRESTVWPEKQMREEVQTHRGVESWREVGRITLYIYLDGRRVSRKANGRI